MYIIFQAIILKCAIYIKEGPVKKAGQNIQN